MSLAKGDAVQVPDGEKRGLWVVTGAWADGRAILCRIEDAVGATVWRPAISTLTALAAEKLAVDPIGRVRPAGD